jgi:hypothetical protein
MASNLSGSCLCGALDHIDPSLPTFAAMPPTA